MQRPPAPPPHRMVSNHGRGASFRATGMVVLSEKKIWSSKREKEVPLCAVPPAEHPRSPRLLRTHPPVRGKVEVVGICDGRQRPALAPHAVCQHAQAVRAALQQSQALRSAVTQRVTQARGSSAPAPPPPPPARPAHPRAFKLSQMMRSPLLSKWKPSGRPGPT